MHLSQCVINKLLALAPTAEGLIVLAAQQQMVAGSLVLLLLLLITGPVAEHREGRSPPSSRRPRRGWGDPAGTRGRGWGRAPQLAGQPILGT